MEEKDEEFEPIPEPDAHGELHGETFAQAERAAAGRPGVNSRLEDVIERIIARGRVRDNTNLPESRKPNKQFEAEPAEEESELEPNWQEFPWELPPNESSDEYDENIPPQLKRRALILHDEVDDPLPIPTALNIAGHAAGARQSIYLINRTGSGWTVGRHRTTKKTTKRAARPFSLIGERSVA